MPRSSHYLAQEYLGGAWKTARSFPTAEAAWLFAGCFKKGRVLYRNRPVPRPAGLSDSRGDGRSIVKRRYRVRYQLHNDTNGDDIASQLGAYLYDRDESGTYINRARLELFAKANGLWSEKYGRLNTGQVRMNVGNRLRTKRRHNPDWQPEWPVLPEDENND